MWRQAEIIWAATLLKAVTLVDTEVPVGGGLRLMKPCDRSRAAIGSFDYCLSKAQRNDLENADCFLVLQISKAMTGGVDVSNGTELLQNALMAFQIIKPIETYGLVFAGTEYADGALSWHHMDDRRWCMDGGGRWAKLSTFDTGNPTLIDRARLMIPRVQSAMSGREIGKRNAVHLLQLSLEHPHPLVACLLAVTGIEAVLSVNGKKDFERELCNVLGAETRVFPDWNSPDFAQPTCTVKDLALDLHTLRSKIAHGRDLREAADDKKFPTDLLEYKEYMPLPASYDPSVTTVQYAKMLGEVSIYLLGQVLEKTL